MKNRDEIAMFFFSKEKMTDQPTRNQHHIVIGIGIF